MVNKKIVLVIKIGKNESLCRKKYTINYVGQIIILGKY